MHAQFDRVLDALADKLPRVAERTEGRRYVGLDVLACCRLRSVSDVTPRLRA